MDAINRSRQSDLFRPEQALSPVTVIGAGGIGSATALELAKMGARLTVLDFDTLEEHNLASQWYRREDVGKPKALALAAELKSYADGDVEARCEKYADQPLSGLVVSAVDSMDTRQVIWDQVRYNPAVDVFIDGRMGGLVLTVLAVRPCDPDHVRWYEQHLFPSSRAAAEPCTARAIAFNTFGIGSFIAGIVRNWWVDGRLTRIIRGDYGSMTFLSEEW